MDTPLRFLQLSDYKFCKTVLKKKEVEPKPKLYPEIKTLLTLLSEKFTDLRLIKLIMNISKAIQITSSMLRRRSSFYIRDFMGYEEFPAWNDPEFSISINNVFMDQIRKSRAAYIISNPSLQQPVKVNHDYRGDKVVTFCGIDSPINLTAPESISSCFGVYDKLFDENKKPKGKKDQVLQKGRKLIIAGYAIYGSCTSLHIGIKGRNGGAHNFSLLATGEFLLSSEDYSMPRYNALYSADEGKCLYYSDNFLQFLQNCKNPEQVSNSNSRHSSSLIADIHQIYTMGGLYIRPPIFKLKCPYQPLLVYQVLPAAFVTNQAGGIAVTQKNELLLDFQPTSINQSSNFMIGSHKNIMDYLMTDETNALI